ncbi:MAG: N-acetylneuraminate synthase family protein [Candidatus Omnitrophica bacterium]|nr:N-acetylneuraminate synthase family protein [Candidatus Omnitrophota bacterium]
MEKIKIGKRFIGDGEPVYVIAEIGSNFDGSKERAKRLADLAKSAGADAVKFQSFLADKIICKEAFVEKTSFQSNWDKPVYEVYQNAVFPREWHKEMADYCKTIGVDFFSSPYDKDAVDLLSEIGVPAFKIGSGDITFLQMLEYIAKKNMPIILGTGASTMKEIEKAVNIIRSSGNEKLILLQCITNYPSPFEQANIRAMVTLREKFNVSVGYSDHTPGSVVPLGAVALGGCVIEKHFTDDKKRNGPDHPFAMDVDDFRSMVKDIRLLEKALGSYEKDLVPAEKETVILQRRSVYAKKDIPKGVVITADMVEILRPAKGISPEQVSLVIGKKAAAELKKGDVLTLDKVR